MHDLTESRNWDDSKCEGKCAVRLPSAFPTLPVSNLSQQWPSSLNTRHRLPPSLLRRAIGASDVIRIPPAPHRRPQSHSVHRRRMAPTFAGSSSGEAQWMYLSEPNCSFSRPASISPMPMPTPRMSTLSRSRCHCVRLRKFLVTHPSWLQPGVQRTRAKVIEKVLPFVHDGGPDNIRTVAIWS